MLGWLKKVVLDIMPSVAATIIGAYIVNYYIIPKARESTAASANVSAREVTAPGGPAADIRTEPAVAEAPAVKAKAAADKASSEKASSEKASSEKASSEKASFEKAVAEKSAIEKAAEKADAAASEARRNQPSSKPAKSAPATTASAPADRTGDERRGVNDLARAAIERLRGPSHAEPAKADVAKTVEAPQVQPVSTVASAPAIQPLPPAINVSTPNSDVFEQGNATPVMRQPYPRAAAQFDEPRRFAPPADIPGSRPLDLRAQASAVPDDRPSIADDVVSTAKSMFHAVIPR